MRVAVPIAVRVFKDTVRDRVPYTLVVFAVLMISASFLIGQLTAGQDVKMIKDLGLAASKVFGLLVAVFIGVSLVATEVERRSIYTLLSKPVRRHEVIVGKYAGLVSTLAANLVILAVVHYGVLACVSATASDQFKRSWEAPAVDPALLRAYFLMLMELMVVAGIALFFSTFSNPILSAALTVGLYVVGHLNSALRSFDEVIDANAASAIAKGLSYVLPSLEPFNITAEVVHGQPVAAEYLVLATGYALTYVALLLVGSMFIFSRRDFT